MPDPNYVASPEKALEAECAALPPQAARGGRQDGLRAGISLSGGGIRSASFNLGLLQSLEALGVLRYFDYLSTVSGGGYIGSWFAACRKNDVPISRFENGRETEAFRHLRRHSRYLTPEGGLFSIDTLTTAGIILRNMLLNQGVLLAFLAVVLMLPLIVRQLYRMVPEDAGRAFFCAAGALLALGIGWVAWQLPKEGKTAGPGPWSVAAWFVYPVSVSSVLFAVSFYRHLDFLKSHPELQLAVVAASALSAALLVAVSKDRRASYGQTAGMIVLSAAGAGIIINAAAGLLMSLGEQAWFGVEGAVSLMPAVLLLVSATMVMSTIGLMGRGLDDGKREWWSRAGSFFAIAAGAWTFLSCIALFIPQLWDHVGGVRGAGPAIASWLGAAASTYRLAGAITARHENKEASGSTWMFRVGNIASILFIAGTLCGVAILNAKVIEWVSYQPWGARHPLAVSFGIALVVAVVFGFQFDVNEFSLNHFYRNRLVRCYMGAAREHRRIRVGDNFTGLDFGDDFEMTKLHPKPMDGKPYPGPFHIVNTSLNLAKSSDLALQDRKADSFAITPVYCGSRTTGYRQTPGYMYESAIKLGTAMSISGAAASPNMGSLTSPAFAFVLTLFNARLGWWIAHPDPSRGGKRPSPAFALRYLLKELFTSTTNNDSYLYLSDGGHFENLGAYELVRRRCHLIVIGDGSADPSYQFDDLANLIRLCRLDFDTEIEIDTSQIASRDGRFGKTHCAVGKIRYPDGPNGVLVYIKSSLCGDESRDVLQYAAKSSDFPHETTADQFFSEEQFESYRALGEHIGIETFRKALDDWKLEEGVTFQSPSILNLTHALRLNWFTAARNAGNFTRHADALERIWAEIRKNRRLVFLDAQMFPSWEELMAGTWPRPQANQWLPRREEDLRDAYYVCQSMLQLMENVYVDVDLERESSHPDNRGWMNLFRHWAGSAMVRVAWALSCQTYGARFQNFLRRELGMGNGELVLEETQMGDCNKVEQREILTARQEFDAPEAMLLGIFLKVRTPVHESCFCFRTGVMLVTPGGNGAPRILHWMRVQEQLQSAGMGRSAVEALRKSEGPTVRHPKLTNDMIASLIPGVAAY